MLKPEVAKNVVSLLLVAVVYQVNVNTLNIT